MKLDLKAKKRIVRNTWITILIIALITGGTLNLLEESVNFVSKAEPNNTPWNATIHVSASEETGYTVILGENSNASDGQDDYDRPLPPLSPQLPLLGAWFDTEFGTPFDKLLIEYKKIPSEYQIWNLSILWESGLTNESSTNIDISWDFSELADSHYDSILLYNNNTTVSDMMEKSNYTFSTEGDIVFQFQIICEKETSSDTSEINIALLLIPAFVIMFIVIIVFYFKKKSV